MSLPTSLRRFFGRSADQPSSPSPNTISSPLYSAIGPRATVGSLVHVSNTGSMGNAVTDGETYLIVDRDFLSLSPSDLVIRYDSARGLNILHRIKARCIAGNGETYYITKGDANADRDSNMTKAEYVGVAVKPVVDSIA